MDEAEELCLGCMKSKGSAVVCPHCGFQMELDRNPQLLPYATVLNSRFLVGRILGSPGGFGITYLAWDLSLHTTVAIKEFFPAGMAVRNRGDNTVRIEGGLNQSDYAGGIEVFLQEARTLARFSHPNIARVRDFFQENNTAYMVMDYYEGVSLLEYLERHGGTLSEAAVLNLVKPVLSGLKEIHEQGFLHRDIKPSNIQITRDGTAVLLDFGSARQYVKEKTATLSVLLTPGYAPLEQYYSKGEQGPWTDVYSVAASIYYLVTGNTPQSALDRLQQDDLVAPIKWNPSLSPRFNLVIMKAMAVKPYDRPQDIESLYRLLGGERTVAVDPAADDEPPATEVVPPHRVSTAKTGGGSAIKVTHLLGMLLLTIGGLIAAILWKESAEQQPGLTIEPAVEKQQPTTTPRVEQSRPAVAPVVERSRPVVAAKRAEERIEPHATVPESGLEIEWRDAREPLVEEPPAIQVERPAPAPIPPALCSLDSTMERLALYPAGGQRGRRPLRSLPSTSAGPRVKAAVAPSRRPMAVKQGAVTPYRERSPAFRIVIAGGAVEQLRAHRHPGLPPAGSGREYLRGGLGLAN